jgi:prenyltransferase beta subunit
MTKQVQSVFDVYRLSLEINVTFAGAFGAHPDHDAHLLSTLSAIQILITQDALDRVDIPRVVKCMKFKFNYISGISHYL